MAQDGKCTQQLKTRHLISELRALSLSPRYVVLDKINGQML